jgi:site-specific DNA-cytosine methylase
MKNKMVKHLNIGENRGKPRLWFEGKSLEANEFEPGTALDVEYGNGYISIHASILEGILEDREWLDESTATVATFVRRAEEHVAKGNGFKSGAVKPSALLVPAITAGHAKRRLTDGMLAHPTKPNTISFFTPREAARIHGIDNSFILPDTKTLAYQVIGNGISVRAWKHSVFGPLYQHLQQTAITASAA